MSAFGGIADMATERKNVRFGPKADIAQRQPNHFQRASLTRYDAHSPGLGGQ
jgi:hypothetical protein